MNRMDITQALLDSQGGQTYLEIGVSQGESFLPVRASRKWGVDPRPRLGRRHSSKSLFLRPLGLNRERIFVMTSDTFFATQSRQLTRYGIDVCLVDGLHTYDQALRDILHVLSYL